MLATASVSVTELRLGEVLAGFGVDVVGHVAICHERNGFRPGSAARSRAEYSDVSRQASSR